MKPREAQIDVDLQALAPNHSQVLTAVFSHSLFLLLFDLAIGALAYGGAWLTRLHVSLPMTETLLPQERWAVVDHPWIALALTQVVFLYFLGLYDDLRLTRLREIVALTFVACLLQMGAITSLFYFTEQVFPRSVILIYDLLNFAGLTLLRWYVRVLVMSRARSALVVAESRESAEEILRDIRSSPWMGLRVSGLLLRDGREMVAAGCPMLESLEEIDEFVTRHRIEEIVFAASPSWRDTALDRLCRLQERHSLRLAILPSVYDMVIGKLRHVNIHDTPLIEVTRDPNVPVERFLKRGFDLLGAVGGLLLLLPLLPFVALAIKVFSPGGTVFYRQERVGRGGRVFELVKFRTMVPDAEQATGETLAEPDDPRITRVGRFLRRTRLDELPQLWNVLKGEMSFVGPRPERPAFVADFARRIPGYHERHRVKPGITGLAQIRSYYHTRAENKLRYDLAYIYNYSFSLDLLILLETVKVVIGRRGT